MAIFTATCIRCGTKERTTDWNENFHCNDCRLEHRVDKFGAPYVRKKDRLTHSGIKYKIDNFEGGNSPLLHFRGRLLQHIVEQRHFEASERGAARDSVGFKFNFGELVVIDSREPYTLPIAEIKIPYSEREETRWAVFAKSFRDMVPAELRTGDDPLAVLDGKMQEWQWKRGRLRQALQDDNGDPIVGADGKQRWGVVEAETWQLVSVDGIGGSGPTLMEQILDFANGHTQDEINNEVYMRMAWKGLPGFQEAATAVGDRTLLPGFVAAGKLTLGADGKYQKVG